RASINRVTSRNDANASCPIGCEPTSSSSSFAGGSPNTLLPSPRKNRVLKRPKEWDGVIVSAGCKMAQIDTYSGAAHAVERREKSRQDVGQILPGASRLPVLAYRDERHVFPELLLQIDVDPLLLLQIARVEPGGAQFLDARTV